MASCSAAADTPVEDSTANLSTELILSKLKSPQLASKRNVVPIHHHKELRGPKVEMLVIPSQYPPLNTFKISNNKLFCTACREPLSIKKAWLRDTKLASKEPWERDMSNMLTQYNKCVYSVWETLPTSIWVKTVTAFFEEWSGTKFVFMIYWKKMAMHSLAANTWEI